MKPFRGVLKNWRRDGDAVIAAPEFLPIGQPAYMTLVDPTAEHGGANYRTEPIIGLEHRGRDFWILETASCFFVLTNRC